MSFKVLHRTMLDEAAYLRCLAFTDSRGEATSFYAQPWYLDIVAKRNWSVAVWQINNANYEIVLPFAHQRKFGLVPEVYMPFLCQQLGCFGDSKQHLDLFIAQLLAYWKSRFFRLSFSFNADSLFAIEQFIPAAFNPILRINQVIDCARSAELIWKNFSATKQKHIRRGERMVLNNPTPSGPQIALEAFVASETGTQLAFSKLQLRIINSIANALEQQNMAISYYYTHLENGQPLLGLLQVRFGNRIISLFGGPLSKDKHNYAQDFALWQSINQIAGLPNAVLDFEGSNLKGVQQYNAAFGAVIKPYLHISWKGW